ncbi:MAG: DUF2339 domain-containing protein, partial [Actinomycetota bacterium]
EGDRLGLGPAAGDLASVLIVAASAFLLTGVVRNAAGSVAYLMALAWIARHLGELDPGYVTAGFAVVGLVALVAGRLGRGRLLTLVGLGTVGLAIAKLILMDLASADPVLKIALSLGMGVALLGVGYWIGDTELIGDREDDSQSEPEEVLPS